MSFKYNIKKIISKKTKMAYLLFYLGKYLPNPLFLLIHITLLCNRKCEWCYQSTDPFFSNHNGRMPVDKFEKILSSMKGFLPKPHVHLFGGEPLCHPEFPEFLKYCRKYGYQPTLTTNGELLEKHSNTILNSSLGQLNISVSRLFDKQGGINQALLSNIKFFTRLNEGKKTINLNFAVDFDNHDYLEKTILYFHNGFKRETFKYYVCQHFMSRDIVATNKKNFNIDTFKNNISRIKNMKLNFGLLFLPDIKVEDLEKYYYSDFAFKNMCYVPWAGMAIYPDLAVSGGGGVFACNKIIGDLNKQPIEEIWHGARLRDFRSKIVKEGLPSVCNRCCQKIYY